MSKRFLISLVTILIMGAMGVAAVYLSKGYTFSTEQKKVVGTGIISITSTPDGASVYIDGHLASATNITLSQLTPRKYSIKLVKEGFIPWEKDVEVKEGLVSEVKATLFPALPTIYPLTVNGAITPLLSPDGQKLAFTVPISSGQHTRQRGGIWVWNMTSQPLAFNRGAEPHQIVISSQSLDFSKSTFRWSPDSKSLLVNMQEGTVSGEAGQRNFLIGADSQTSLDNLKDITPMLDTTIKGWEEDEKTKEATLVATISNLQIRQTASASAVLKWSPDESKIIVGNTKEQSITKVAPTLSKTVTPAPQGPLKGFKVIDLLTNKQYDLPEANAYFWLPDSRHVILIQEGKVSLCEHDGTNVSVIYAGTFEDSAIFPWPDSSRLVILTTFNTPTASVPNLFGINLK